MALKHLTEDDRSILNAALKSYKDSMERNNPRELPAVKMIRQDEAAKIAATMARLQQA